MNEGYENLRGQCATLYESGASVQDVLSFLRDSDLSLFEVTKIVLSLTRLRLVDAQQLIACHAAWSADAANVITGDVILRYEFASPERDCLYLVAAMDMDGAPGNFHLSFCGDRHLAHKTDEEQRGQGLVTGIWRRIDFLPVPEDMSSADSSEATSG